MKNGIIICPIHGKFLQSPNSHCQGQGCPKCSESHGEKEVEKWLTIHKINHIRQKTFENCISPISHRKLRFDFFVPCKNTLIEYDGEQHFKIGKYIRKHKITKRDFEKIRFHDSLKTKYAKSNKIEIIRIPYTKKKSIPQILETKLL